MKIEDRIDSIEVELRKLDSRTEHVECLRGTSLIHERITSLEKEIDKLKALYEMLHGAVSKSVKGCEHDWKYVINKTEYKCSKCGEVRADKPTQTLAESLYDKFNAQYPELDYEFKSYGMYKHTGYVSKENLLKLFVEIAESHYKPSLQSEYQRGKEEGYLMYSNENMPAICRIILKNEREALMEKFDKFTEEWYVTHKAGEQKFKVWDKKEKCWVADGRSMDLYYSAKVGCFMFDNDNYDLTRKEIELVQFTGLLDSKGVEIYEGDILGVWDERTIKKHWKIVVEFGEVDFHRDAYTNCIGFYGIESGSTMKQGLKSSLSYERCEVIGNIYSNPDLLASPAADQERKL